MSLTQGQDASVRGDAADLVARIAAGDRGAEATFVSQYLKGVRVLVRRHCRPNDPICDDLVQDVLSRVLERLRAGAIRDAEALPAYIRTTIVHTAGAEYRNRRSIESIDAAEHVAAQDNPATHVASSQLSVVLKTLLAELPVQRDREILSSFYLEDSDKEDVCSRLAIEHDHFHRVLFRARERFRELLLRAGIEGA